ncbi:MAG: glycine zipper 2TM domain-containing protein [Nitrosomonas sp.]|jgi:outer membrane lipoprotein SlyB|nr:glycine zipper 2TM domain-containing protein [Nitrosomonas sp.]
MKKFAAIGFAAVLVGCATGENHQANVYKSSQVNTAQNVKTVVLLGVQSAKIEVDNTKGKQAAQLGGALLGTLAGAAVGNQVNNNRGTTTVLGAVGGGAVGAAAGSLVSDKALVDGVSITYKIGSELAHSAQIGKLCEFKQGDAIMVSTTSNETRIQPNNPEGCNDKS